MSSFGIARCFFHCLLHRSHVLCLVIIHNCLHGLHDYYHIRRRTWGLQRSMTGNPWRKPCWRAMPYPWQNAPSHNNNPQIAAESERQWRCPWVGGTWFQLGRRKILPLLSLTCQQPWGHCDPSCVKWCITQLIICASIQNTPSCWLETHPCVDPYYSLLCLNIRSPLQRTWVGYYAWIQ